MNAVTLNDKFRKAMSTLYEMLIIHRGYESMNQVVSKTNVFLVNKKDEPTKSIIVLLIGNEKLNIDGVKEMIQIIENLNVHHGIIVYQNTVTSSAKKTLDLLYQYKIELFALNELQYDITKHMYFFPHEKVENLSELGVLKNQLTKLPKIVSTDPVVRYFAFQKGDVLRIKRPNQVIAYRIVK